MVNTPFLLLGVFVSRNISSVGCACCSRLNSLKQEIGLLGSCGFEACATSVAHIYIFPVADAFISLPRAFKASYLGCLQSQEHVAHRKKSPFLAGMRKLPCL